MSEHDIDEAVINALRERKDGLFARELLDLLLEKKISRNDSRYAIWRLIDRKKVDLTDDRRVIHCGNAA